ncbi:ral GTPase-activating protein subunit alpha-1-like isoform X7 [Styela clava]
MFQIHKKPQGDAAVKKSVQKILDPKKDIVTRLKHLRLVLDNVTDPAEEQAIFEQYYSHIYYVFYENFLLAEANVRQKGAHRAQREELDGMLQIFETILVRLPEMLHERWQYNSIDRIIKTLLHPGNSLKMRRDGVKFFLLWFRALNVNAKESTILLYASIVPGFPSPPAKNELYSGCYIESLINPVPDNSQTGVCPAEITCLLPPPAGEKNPHDLTKFFLDIMLEYMVVEACKLQWKDRPKMETVCFSFLWNMFKKYYLPHIFDDFHFDTSVYQPNLSLPEPRGPVNYILNVTDTGSIDPCIEVGPGCPMLPARVSTIKWVIAFTSDALHNENKNRGARSDVVLDGLSRLLKSHMMQQRLIVGSVIGLPDRQAIGEADSKMAGGNSSGGSHEQEASHSNTSTLTEKAPSLSSLSSLDDKLKSTGSATDEEELVRNILYSTRENVNIVHEVFRQALMLPLTEAPTMRRVVKVYQEWIQDGITPIFMEEPDLSAMNDPTPVDNTVVNESDDEEELSNPQRKTSSTSTSSLRNVSYMRGQLNPLLDQALSTYVQAGCQTTYQLFVTNSAHVFLVEPPDDAHKLIQAQVDVCKRVLNLYRHMVMHVNMNSTTWTQLLQVLLHITRIMLQDAETPKSIRVTTVAGRLAGPVFQTLIVSWIKANLFVHVSRELWDELVDVLSSLMHWKDLIVEWAKNMDTMTRVLARHVYGLELSDLPLDRLTEQKQMRNRKAALRERLAKPAEKSFSKGWSRESVPPNSGRSARMRSQTAIGDITESHVTDSRTTPALMVNGTKSDEIENNFSVDRRGRSVTVLGLEAAPETDRTLQNVPGLGGAPEHTGGHLPLKRGMSDSSNLSSSPPGTLTIGGKLDSNLQRSSSTSDISRDKIEDNYREHIHIEYNQPGRQRCNSGPGYREDMRVHGLRTQSSDNDGVTSLCSVEDAFNDMFDELAQQRLSTVNPKPVVAEVWNAPTDVISIKSQDSGSIDPNWNPWAESDAQPTTHDDSAEGQDQLYHETEAKRSDEYADAREEDYTSEWGNCLEDSNYDTSSETASPGVPSPPYQLYKHVARDRYDSTALLIPDPRRDTSRNETRESIAEEEIPCNDSPDADTLFEKSSDDILGVHTSTPHITLSKGTSDLSGDESMDENNFQQDKTGDSILAPSEDCSILAGGRRTGWYPDVAVALWRRLLGILGDVNKVEDPVIHQLIFTYLLKFWKVLFKMRDNLGITTDNMSTPEPPQLVPPLRIMAPWAFKAVMSLPDSHKGGCLHAYQLLCNTTLQTHDTRLEPEHLALFYMILHEGLHSDQEQDKVNEIVESSSPRFFSCGLPASTLLLLDFIYACHAVAASTDLSGPRVEAQTLLGSVLCFPNLYYDLPVLNPDSKEPQALMCNNIKEYVADALLTSAKKEPSAPARCVALSSLGVWLYEELTSSVEEATATPTTVQSDGIVYDTNLSPVKGRILARHGRVKEAINVMLVSLKFNNRVVAGVACSQLHLLTHCIPQLLEYMPEMPSRIIEVMSLTASSLLQSSEAKSSDSGRQLLVSLLLCICDWCMLVPLDMLIEITTPGTDKRLIRTVFKALQTGALGKPGHSAKHSYSLSDLASKDFDPNLQLDKVSEGSSSSINGSGQMRNNKLPLPPMPNVSIGTDNVVSLTASTVLSHLTNHLGHFPLAKGPAVLNSMVTEQQDHGMDNKNLSADLSNNLFSSPNVQFLIYNDSCLLSMVEINAQKDVPGGGPTAGLSTAPTNVRLIIRDTSGKFCWDSSILYGLPDLENHTKPVSHVPLSTLDVEISKVISEHCSSYISYAESEIKKKTKVKETPLPSHDVSLPSEQSSDKLDQLLQYVGYSSPECQEFPGRPLNIPASPSRVLDDTKLQGKALEYILKQHKSQSTYYSSNAHHTSCQSRSVRPLTYSPPQPSFHQSRLLISQTAFLSKENRRRVTLLKKNERLLRELKNLDSRHCRETHKVAVLYIAPGQEDKLSVLSNTAGSKDFENFVCGLGWEVDLKTHCGFRGKLHADGSTGSTSPYYATSTLEVVFHVSTRFPSTNDDSRNIKLKHLGNDEVHIVWSEHSRDYRRGIIPTEFGDVLIIIYPMKHMLYRIQIKKKDEVPYFGPLFDGAIVNARVLPVLVRETAINAGRAKRSQISLYQPFYEERAKYLRQIIDQFRDDTTFEDYAAQLFSPGTARNLSPAAKLVPKRPAPKPSPPLPASEMPQAQSTPMPPTFVSQPSPIVGKVLPLAAQQPFSVANSNNNNSGIQSSVIHEVTSNRRRHVSTDSDTSVQSNVSTNIPPIKEVPNIEEFDGGKGARYTPGHQVSSNRAVSNPSPTPPVHKSSASHLLISTPRPKPSASSHPTSISALSFSQNQQQTPVYPTSIDASTKIHIPVSKLHPTLSKSSNQQSTQNSFFKRHSASSVKTSSATNSGIILVPPPPTTTKSVQRDVINRSLSSPASPTKPFFQVTYQDHAI